MMMAACMHALLSPLWTELNAGCWMLMVRSFLASFTSPYLNCKAVLISHQEIKNENRMHLL
jgi:hypothetical protein